MRIIGLETVQVEAYSNLVWVRLHTDEGLVGLGETFRNTDAIVTYLHATCAPNLIGADPLRRDWIGRQLGRRIGNHFNGFPTRCVEVCGNSAVDLALWDIAGQRLGTPLYQLLGGATRERIRIYNTCAGGSYNARARTGYNTELVSRDGPAPAAIAPREDLLMQVFEPVRLAEELLAAGVTAMKIWPFDPFALQAGGAEISAEDLRKAIWPIEQIRRAVGDRMDIMIEYHGLWRLAPALKIAAALADYAIYWHEEPIWMQNFDDLARYRARVEAPVCGSENLGTVPWYREMFTRGAVDIANFDMGWIGGLSEGQRIACLADAFDRPIAPHDCTGPVTLAVNVHLLAAAPNGLLAETVRAHTEGFYREIVTDLPPIAGGFIAPLQGAGLGTRLSDDLLGRADLRTRLSGQRAE